MGCLITQLGTENRTSNCGDLFSVIPDCRKTVTLNRDGFSVVEN